jgi:hypothetical protein
MIWLAGEIETLQPSLRGVMNEFEGGEERDDPGRDDPGRFRAGDTVQLREPHWPYAAGARARIIGFYRTSEPEAVLELEDGQQLRVPCTKLERTVEPAR